MRAAGDVGAAAGHLVIRPIFSGQDATMARICASSSAVSSRGNLNKTMCCRVIGNCPP